MVRTVRLYWLLLSLALMFASAYFAMLCIGAVGTISGWIGLPAYAAALEKIQRQAQWWRALALVLPFVAASVLTLGRRVGSVATEGSVESRGLAGFFKQYVACLIASILGTLCFLLVLFLISLLLYKLGIHSRGLASAVSESAGNAGTPHSFF
jgi:hypothetical protein